MKMMNTEELLNVLRGLTEGGSEVSMPVSGNSMEPFLKNERDRVCFRKPKTPLKRGDIVFYQRSNGQSVMHRIQKIMPEAYFLVGDAQTEVRYVRSRFLELSQKRREEESGSVRETSGGDFLHMSGSV